MLPKIVSRALVLSMASARLSEKIMQNHFLKNFKGFNREKLEVLMNAEEYADVIADRWTDNQSGITYYPLELDMNDIPDLDPWRCLEKAGDNYSDAFYENEEHHLTRSIIDSTGNHRFWWINHIMRQYFPDNIRFHEWQSTDALGKSKRNVIRGGRMWADIIDYELNDLKNDFVKDDSVWKKFVQRIMYVFMWNTKIMFEGEFKKYPIFIKNVYAKKEDVIHEKFKKYYMWMRHTLFHTDDQLIAWQQEDKFENDDANANQIYIIARFLEILQFVSSDKCLNYMLMTSKNIVAYCRRQDNTNWKYREMGDWLHWNKRRHIWKMARRMRMLVMMLRNITLENHKEVLCEARGEVPKEFQKELSYEQ